MEIAGGTRFRLVRDIQKRWLSNNSQRENRRLRVVDAAFPFRSRGGQKKVVEVRSIIFSVRIASLGLQLQFGYLDWPLFGKILPPCLNSPARPALFRRAI